MSNRKDGGPAFPQSYEEIAPVPDDGKLHHQQKYTVIRPGMSLRDYLAAAACQGMLSSNIGSWLKGESSESTYEAIARKAYGFADAMLSERDK